MLSPPGESEVSQLWYVFRGGRGLQRSEIGEHVRDVLVADPLLLVGRHVQARLAHLHEKRLPGEALRDRWLRAAPAALAVGAVAGVAAEIDEEFFPPLDGTLGRVLGEHRARAQGPDDGNG